VTAAGPGRRVLLVDDYAPFRDAARQVLADAGFDVVADAGDAAGALRLARRLHPDVALVDVELPDLDGFELAGRLSRLPRAPAVVLISGRPQADYGGLIERSGARGFIDKADLSGPRLRAELG
jgi:two-component system, NarL family, nitrate/nitrite response regulator NarL